MTRIDIEHNDLKMVIEITEAGDVRLQHFSALDFDPALLGSEERPQQSFRLVELQATGYNQKIWLYIFFRLFIVFLSDCIPCMKESARFAQERRSKSSLPSHSSWDKRGKLAFWLEGQGRRAE